MSKYVLQNMELTNSLWMCQRARPLDDHHVFGPQYLAVVPEENCVVILHPISFPDSEKVVISAYAAWYERVAENELRIVLVTRSGSKWKPVYYYEDADYLQWFEPRDCNDFNMFASKVPWNFLDNRYLKSFNRAIDRAKSIGIK